MDNLYAMEPEIIARLRADLTELRTVASFSVLASSADPLRLLDGCFVLPTNTDDTHEERDDEARLVSLTSIQEWQVLIAVPNVTDPDDWETTAKRAGAYLAQVRASLLGWNVPAEFGGLLHPGGVSGPVHARDFTQFPLFFRQHLRTNLEPA
jgi:hypothetical protein